MACLKADPEIDPDRDIRPIGGPIVEAEVLERTFEGTVIAWEREVWRPLGGNAAERSPLLEEVVGRIRGPLDEPKDSECWRLDVVKTGSDHAEWGIGG